MIKDDKVKVVIDGKEEWRSIAAYDAKPLEQNTFTTDRPPPRYEALPVLSRNEIVHKGKDGETIIIDVSL